LSLSLVVSTVNPEGWEDVSDLAEKGDFLDFLFR
jgi:hypothetical protein